MDLNLIPCVTEGLYYNELYNNKNCNYIVVGNKKLGTSIVVKDDSILDIYFFIKEIDGIKSLNEIKEKLSINEANLINTVKLLQKNGIIEINDNSSEVIKIEGYNEADKSSIKLYEKSLEGIKIKSKNIVKITNWFKNLLILNIVSCIILSVNYFIHNDAIILLNYHNSYFKTYLLVNIFMVISFVLHEIAHVISAQKYGASCEKFAFLLYWFFIPMMYVKNKNLYSLPKKNLIKVLLSGIALNFFIFTFSFNLFYVFHIDICRVIGLANLKIALVNLIPLSLSDGYFIFTLLLGKPNLRKQSYALIGNKFKRSIREKCDKSDVIYAVASFISILFSFSFEVLCFTSSLEIFSMHQLIIINFTIVLSYIVFYYNWIKRKLC